MLNNWIISEYSTILPSWIQKSLKNRISKISLLSQYELDNYNSTKRATDEDLG